MRQIAHLRLLYGVVIVLTTSLLLVGGAYRLKARQAQDGERMRSLLREQQVEILDLRAQLTRESKAREHAVKRLNQWETIHPYQAEALQKTQESVSLAQP